MLRVIYSTKAEGVTDAHKKDVFTSICEIIFTQEKIISTRKIARLMFYLGALVQLVDIRKQSGYFMGALFAVGGILKIEARNYLETK